MDETLLLDLEPPRLETINPLQLVGLSQRYTPETAPQIPQQWTRFAPHIGHIPGQVGDVTYGVVYNGDGKGNIDYLSAVEVAGESSVPEGLIRLQIPEQRYAVFTQPGHISTIQRTWKTIFKKAMPESGYQIAHSPEIERYGPEFDPRTGEGGFEIWIPVKP